MPQPLTHVNQHYVPDFLLSQWHSGKHDMLFQYNRIGERLIHTKRGARGVANSEHLYSKMSEVGEFDVDFEKKYLGPEIDGKAAIVHKMLMKEGATSISSRERLIWAQFLTAQRVRIPYMVEHFRSKVLEEFDRNVNEMTNRLMRESFREMALLHRSKVTQNIAVDVLKYVIESDKLNNAILNCQSWFVRKLDNSNVDLLIGDNPLIIEGPLTGRFLMMLPLAPRLAFCAATHIDTEILMLASEDFEVVKSMNRHTVSVARTYVYAKDLSQTDFIDQYLGRRGRTQSSNCVS